MGDTCGCGRVGKEIMEYHKTRGFCDDPSELSYNIQPVGLTKMLGSYLPSNNRENYR